MEIAGGEVPIIWNGRRARAFVPTLLSERDFDLDHSTVDATARARTIVEIGAEELPADWEPLARLLLRAEGIASSFIEGITAPVVDIVLAESTQEHSPARWVAANLAAVTGAIDAAHDGPLTIDHLCQWHRTLMTGSPTPERYVGRLRAEQGWIGGTSPLDAHLVTPPPALVSGLMDDLITWINGDTVDPITQAAVAHAQFEIIHPFADGNGRIGRVLIAWILVRRLSLLTPPPVSTGIAADVGGYQSGLVLYRMGDHNSWIKWMAQAISGAGRSQQELIGNVASLSEQWRSTVASGRQDRRRLRSDSTVWQVLDLLPRLLVVTGTTLSKELGVPPKTANAAIEQLVDVGILVPQGTIETAGRPSTVYVSPDLLGLTGSNPLRA